MFMQKQFVVASDFEDLARVNSAKVNRAALVSGPTVVAPVQ